MLNYRGLDVDGSTLAFITLGLDVEPDEIRTLMDFVVFADE
jgi:hypothetical protein